MPTLSEFALMVHLRREEESGVIWTVFTFSTVREFRSFQYEIQVDEELNRERREISFHIRGVRAPANLMPSYGAAGCEIAYPGLNGTYDVVIAGAKQVGRFSFSIRAEAIDLLEAPADASVRVRLLREIELVRS